MPLSEEELRLLEQMERALVEEDPKFASTLRGTSLRRTARRRAIAAALGFAVGVVVLMTGAISQTIVVGVVGFVLMLVTATLGLAALRGQHQVRGEGPAPASAPDGGRGGFSVIDGGRSRGRRPKGAKQARPSDPASGSFMQRMEQRWRKRRDTNGF